jgi:hypothetical protein
MFSHTPNRIDNWLYRWHITPVVNESKDLMKSLLSPKAEHKCTCGWPGSVPMGISNSKCYTWISAGFSHWVTWNHESKTCGFSSTCGSTGTWKYLQVLRILNRNKLFNCKYKCMWNKIFLRHGVTLWWNQIWLDWLSISYQQSALSSHLHSHPTSKTL